MKLYIDILTYDSSGETRPVKVIDGVMKNGELHDLNANVVRIGGGRLTGVGLRITSLKANQTTGV